MFSKQKTYPNSRWIQEKCICLKTLCPLVLKFLCYLYSGCFRWDLWKTIFKIIEFTVSLLKFSSSKQCSILTKELIRRSFMNRNFIFSRDSKKLCLSSKFIFKPISTNIQSIKYYYFKLFKWVNQFVLCLFLLSCNWSYRN